jgi:hypothetical protein
MPAVVVGQESGAGVDNDLKAAGYKLANEVDCRCL